MNLVELQNYALERAKRFRLGDKIASVATPIARHFSLKCIDPNTHELKPDSRCNKLRNKLNS